EKRANRASLLSDRKLGRAASRTPSAFPQPGPARRYAARLIRASGSFGRALRLPELLDCLHQLHARAPREFVAFVFAPVEALKIRGHWDPLVPEKDDAT